MRFRYGSDFRMRKTSHSWPAMLRFRLVLVAALSLLAVYENVRSLHAQKEPDKPHSVTISWSADNPPVAGYNVYRASPPAARVKLTAKPIPDTQYIDRAVEAGRTYSYSVTAVDSKGRESKPSGIVTVTIPTAVPPPANL